MKPILNGVAHGLLAALYTLPFLLGFIYLAHAAKLFAVQPPPIVASALV